MHNYSTGDTRSSAEAKIYAAVMAAAAAIGCVSKFRGLGGVLQQQGVEVRAKMQGDSTDNPSIEIQLGATASRAIAMRRGAGRIKHTSQIRLCGCSASLSTVKSE